ncbi:MAG TPA: hypothetical protein VFN03_07565, partial [Trueperaceae bacterium]|nr:hypothetical protein [Trueperaceae bacterium]
SRYDVTLTDTVGVTVGGVLVANESASLVGRVVAVTDPVVTLEVIPLYEVVVSLDLGEERLDLSTAAYQLTPETERYFDVTTSDGGLYHLDLKPGVELTGAIGTQAAEFSVGPFHCSASGTAASLDLAVAKFTLAPNLDLHVEWNSQRRALIVTGQPTITYQVKPVLNAALEGSVDCRITLLEPKIPLPGFLGFFLGGVIPIGTGFQIHGQLPVASVGLEVTGSLGLNVAAGFDCPATQACSYPNTLESHGSPPKIAPVAPQLAPGVKLELTAHAYAFAGLQAGITSNKLIKALGTTITSIKNYRLDLLEAKGGLKLKVELAGEQTQVDDPAYRSAYSITFEAGISAGKSITAFLDLVKLTAIDLSFNIAPITLGSSPTMVTATISDHAFEAGDEVTFTVQLDPAKLSFLGQHNVAAVRIYRQSGGALVLANESTPPTGQASVTVPWVASLDAEAGMTFHAFVETHLLPGVRFELGQVEVTPPGTIYAGTLNLTWLERRTLVETWKPHETSNGNMEYLNGEARSEYTATLQAVLEVEVEEVGDDLIFTVFDQSLLASEELQQSLDVSYRIAEPACNGSDTNTVESALHGGHQNIGAVIFDGGVFETHLSADISGTMTVIFDYPCPAPGRSGTEVTHPASSLGRWFAVPLHLDPAAPSTMVGQDESSVEDSSRVETDAKISEFTSVETFTWSWELLPQ